MKINDISISDQKVLSFHLDFDRKKLNIQFENAIHGSLELGKTMISFTNWNSIAITTYAQNNPFEKGVSKVLDAQSFHEAVEMVQVLEEHMDEIKISGFMNSGAWMEIALKNVKYSIN